MGFLIHIKNAFLHLYYKGKADRAWKMAIYFEERNDVNRFFQWRHVWYVNEQKKMKYPLIY